MKDHEDSEAGQPVEECLGTQLLHIRRDGAWHKLSDLGDWLSSRALPETTSSTKEGKKSLKGHDGRAVVGSATISFSPTTRHLLPRKSGRRFFLPWGLTTERSCMRR